MLVQNTEIELFRGAPFALNQNFVSNTLSLIVALNLTKTSRRLYKLIRKNEIHRKII